MKVQTIKCPKCKVRIYSRARHDMRSCDCPTYEDGQTKGVTIDGGQAYCIYSWGEGINRDDLDPKDIEIESTPQELYNDWNKQLNKLGKIYETETTFKVGDIVILNERIMVLTEKLDNRSPVIKRHGPAVFKAHYLITRIEDVTYNVYESQLKEMRLATDEDIVNRLIDVMLTIEISDETDLVISPEDETVYLANGEDWIPLYKEDIKKLKEALKEIEV